jgi:hypothetical protein
MQDRSPTQITCAPKKTNTPSIPKKRQIVILPQQKDSSSVPFSRARFEPSLPVVYEDPIDFLQKKTKQRSRKSQSAEEPFTGSLVYLLETILGEKLPRRPSTVTEALAPTDTTD